jgi:hypothetical protein
MALVLRHEPDGSATACLLREGKWASPSTRILPEDLKKIASLSYGESVWISAAAEPVFRFSGRGEEIEIAENNPESSGPWLFDQKEIALEAETG